MYYRICRLELIYKFLLEQDCIGTSCMCQSVVTTTMTDSTLGFPTRETTTPLLSFTKSARRNFWETKWINTTRIGTVAPSTQYLISMMASLRKLISAAMLISAKWLKNTKTFWKVPALIKNALRVR